MFSDVYTKILFPLSMGMAYVVFKIWKEVLSPSGQYKAPLMNRDFAT